MNSEPSYLGFSVAVAVAIRWRFKPQTAGIETKPTKWHNVTIIRFRGSDAFLLAKQTWQISVLVEREITQNSGKNEEKAAKQTKMMRFYKKRIYGPLKSWA